MVYKFFIVATVLWINVPNYKANDFVELLPKENPVTYDELEFWEPDPKFDTRRRGKNKSNEQKTNDRGKTSKSTTDGYRKRTVKYASKSALKRQTKNTTTLSNNKMKFRAMKVVSEDALNASASSNRPSADERVDAAFDRVTGSWLDSTAATDFRWSNCFMFFVSTRIDTNVDPKQTTKSQTKSWWSDQSKSVTFQISPYAIAQQLIDITSKMPEANVTTEILGHTAEFSDIVLLKITEKKSEIDKYFRADDSKYIDEVPEKKIIFIVHALSVMGVNKMKVFQESQFYTKLFSFYFAHLDKFDIFLIPMANPDGYAYMMNNKLFGVWNKNRSPQNGCAGVALDRNFDVKWNTTKPISACSQQYPGFTPFSEPETRAVREVLHKYSHKIIAYMHLHAGSYKENSFKGDAVLYPKGYSDVQTDDDRYIDLRGEIDEAIRNASFVNLSVAVDTLYNWYGKVFGTSVDYASSVYGIPYSMELVMQSYNLPIYSLTEETPSDIQSLEMVALEHVWGTVIDVIFKNIWKSLHANEVQ